MKEKVGTFDVSLPLIGEKRLIWPLCSNQLTICNNENTLVAKKKQKLCIFVVRSFNKGDD